MISSICLLGHSRVCLRSTTLIYVYFEISTVTRPYVRRREHIPVCTFIDVIARCGAQCDCGSQYSKPPRPAAEERWRRSSFGMDCKRNHIVKRVPPNSGQILLVHQMGGQSTAAASNLNCQILSMSIGVTVRIFADSLTMPNARTRAMLLFLARGVVTGGSRQNMCLVMSVESLSHCVGDNATSLSDTDSAVAIPLLWAVCIKGARMCIIC